MAQISIVPAPPPAAASDASCADIADSLWIYELQPALELPTLDFTRSLKSRFLNTSAAKCVDFIASYRRTIGVAALIANILVLVTLAVPSSVGRVVAFIAFALWIVPVLIAVSSLRYDFLRLLLHTYDFWFSSFVNLAAFTTFGTILGNSRAAAVVGTWSGVQLNIAIDANLRCMQAWLYFNVIAVIVYSVVWVAVSFALIDRLDNVSLVRYRSHELPATAFVASGLVTIIALIARNVYRRRGILHRHSCLAVIECVSYRTDLRICSLAVANAQQKKSQPPPQQQERQTAPAPLQSTSADVTVTTATTTAPPELPTSPTTTPVPRRPEHLVALQYVKTVGRIDARDTLLPRTAREWLVATALFQCCRAAKIIDRVRSSKAIDARVGIRAVSISSSSVGSIAMLWLSRLLLCSITSSVLLSLCLIHSHLHAQAYVHILGFALTLPYCALSAAHYQRALLLALVTTFDFVFLAAQVTMIHVCACQFYAWRLDKSLAAATTWLWALWLLCLDALPPVTRRRLRISPRFVIAVLLLLIASALVLLCFVVFTDAGASDAYTHTMWRATLFGSHHLELKWSSVFFNCFATMTALVARLAWRAITLECDVLLLLDGAVMFENNRRVKVSTAATAPVDGRSVQPSGRAARQ